MQSNQTKIDRNYLHNDLNFLPTLFSGFAGVAIGIIIGNFLGWI